jgi:hypothetical protein
MPRRRHHIRKHRSNKSHMAYVRSFIGKRKGRRRYSNKKNRELNYL